ncbi:MAG: biotin/lipoyl-containing protein [Chloroflexota bacterium]
MAETNDADRATIARLTDDVLPTLIERLAKSQLGELEVRESGWRIRLRRPDGQAAADVQTASAHTATHRTSSAGHGTHPTADAHMPRREPLRGVITSPAVGYFSPRGGLATGINVRRGDVIGVVDVLGVRQDVVSPADGVLKELDVESGGAVEFGQPIGRVEANVQ